MRPLDQHIKNQLEEQIKKLEELLDADIIAILSPIIPGLEGIVREAIEQIPKRKKKLAIMLETPGGSIEVIERMVETIRFHYKEVIFLIPNRAMSAGTVFVMSGDKIYMDYFACLGPIDPQFEKDGKWIPALSYVLEFDRLNEKARIGELTTAEYALIAKLDLCELHQFKQAQLLSIELIEKWLSKFKFKNWKVTRSKKTKVTPALKKKRAKEIAQALNNIVRWRSHGRGINMETLTKELKLEINDMREIKGLSEAILGYYELLSDYMNREKYHSFVHTKEFF